MKKRFMAGVVAAVTALAMSISVLAAGSIVGSIDMPNASVDRGSVTLSPVAPGIYADDLQKVVDDLNAADADTTVTGAFGNSLPSSFDYYTQEGLKIKGYSLDGYKFLSPVMDLKVTGTQASLDNLMKITFVANNMTDGMVVDILYYCSEHGWEVLKGVRVSGNQIMAYFHSVSEGSPVALIYKRGTVSGENNDKGSTSAVSPKTGQSSMVPVAGAALVFLGIGAFAVLRSKKEN